MPTCLVIGASGYIGTLLVDALGAAGHDVRAMARSLTTVPEGVTAIRADVEDPTALAAAMSDVDVAYHLVHSMAGDDFADVDERIATAVADAAAAAGVRQLIYLGGPRPPTTTSPTTSPPAPGSATSSSRPAPRPWSCRRR